MRVEAPAYRLVCVSTPRRTPYWRPAEKGLEKAQYFIVIRAISGISYRLSCPETNYSDRCPCLTCTVKIAQVGISEVVYSKSYNMDKEVGILVPLLTALYAHQST